MSMNIAGYVEKKVDGKWELVTNTPICSRLKYILPEYMNYNRLKFDDLSEGLKSKFKKDENGDVYASFFVTTLNDLEKKLDSELTKTFIEVNTIVKALGCSPSQDDYGEEIESIYEGDVENGKGNPLTIPINKDLVYDLECAMRKLREVGQREALDLFLNDYMDYGFEYRIVLAMT